jgi:hypothetical protein
MIAYALSGMQAVCKRIEAVNAPLAEPNSNISSFVRLRAILNGTLKFYYIRCRGIKQAYTHRF